MNDRTITDLAAKCIRCGFCLESCPTYQETGEETESPRARIYLIKSAERNEIPWSSIREPLDHCLGCRACETACPSGVEYGHLLELGRAELGPSKPQRLAIKLATSIPLLWLARTFRQTALPRWVANRLSGGHRTLPNIRFQPARSGVANRESTIAIPSSKIEHREVVFLDGCAMRVLFPRVHEASKALLALAGFRVVPIDLGCCGALHAHGGQLAEGVAIAERVRSLAGRRPVVTDSAGCGAWLKQQGIDTMDLSEGIADLDLSQARWSGCVTYHDACHLAHGQGLRDVPRDLIRRVPGVDFVELPEADTCCGSAGTYNLTQPDMANRLLDRKWRNIRQTGAQTVVLANPGCHSWIGQGAAEGVRVMHLAEFLVESLRT